jgi:omega-6 fatty acid desaturase (delta-12 desaturase)
MSLKKIKTGIPAWKTLASKYQKSETGKSIWQFCNTFIPFIISWYLMYRSIEISYWLTLLLVFPTTGFIMRLFIIQHDCGHGSFFKSKKANDRLGAFCSIFTLTPYHYWKKTHAIHHASTGNLAQRGVGDIYTMTVDEYMSKSKWGKFRYRLNRNPFILFFIIPAFLFVIIYRFPSYRYKELKPFYNSVYITSAVIILFTGALIWLIGLKAFLIVQLPVSIISSSAGMWMFYVQHQFEDTYWNDKNDWDYADAAMRGSSYYKLPKVLQWFTGNIGFHHIHHLSPKIPNYKLEKCHKENPDFQKVVTLTLKTSFKSMFLNLWDEKQQKLISFSQLKRRNVNLGYSAQNT